MFHRDGQFRLDDLGPRLAAYRGGAVYGLDKRTVHAFTVEAGEDRHLFAGERGAADGLRE